MITSPTRTPGLTPQARIDYIFQSINSIYDRCDAIKNLCVNEMSLREFAVHLPYLLKYILCLDHIKTSGDIVQTPTSLCVGCLSTRNYTMSRDANAVMSLLSPDGPIFSLLYQCKRKNISIKHQHLHHDATILASHDFINRFVKPVGKVPGSSDGQMNTCVLEIYFIAFAIYGLSLDKSYDLFKNKNTPSQYGGYANHIPSFHGSEPVINRNDIVYNQLLLLYMKFFMPLDLVIPKIIHDKSATASLSPEQKPRSVDKQPFSPIFKRNAFSKTTESKFQQPLKSQSHICNNIALENATFLLSLADSLTSSLTKVWFSKEFWPAKSNYMLYEEHVRNLRLVVKHVISFATTDQTKCFQYSHEIYISEIMSLIQNLQSTILQRHIQPNIFPMLNAVFECWNMPPKIMSPSYFRTIVELWLSYIQPWRYNDETNPGNQTFAGQERQRLPDALTEAKCWLPYISSNIQCYTTLLEDILRRALRVDLSSPQEATILFRTVRVFSQRSLVPLVYAAAEKSNPSNNCPTKLLKTSILHPPGKAPFSNIKEIVHELISSCQQILAKKYNHYGSAAQPEKFSLTVWLNQLFTEEAKVKETCSKESKQIEQRLSQSIQQLSELFNVPIPTPPETEQESFENSPTKLSKLGNRLEQHNTLAFDDDFAEFELAPDLHSCTLTDVGREQLLASGGLKHAPIIMHTHYDDLPIMSTEFRFMVYLLGIIGTFLTAKFQPYLKDVADGREGYIYRYGRFWFLTAPNGMRYQTPRISVRFLAHIGLWMYITFFYLMSKLFGFSMATLLFYVAILALLYSITAVFFQTPLKTKQH